MTEYNPFTSEFLRELQSYPLSIKVGLTKNRIRDWYNFWNGQVYVSCSGGKDSTVLLHLVHELYPDVPAIYCDTGLEYPEIRQFAKGLGCEFQKPRMIFTQVVTDYGYPIVSKEVSEAIYYARRANKNDPELRGGSENDDSEAQGVSWKAHGQRGGRTRNRREMLLGRNGAGVKDGKKSIFNKEKWLPLAEQAPFRISNYCCNVMKKRPAHAYESREDRKPYIGMLAEESKMRRQGWMRTGCNAFYAPHKVSNPMAFWTEQDVLQYIKDNNLPICSVYGDIIYEDKKGQLLMEGAEGGHYRTTGCDRTGCMFCGFGAHNEKGVSRFQRLKETHPHIYEYCIGGGQWIDNPDYIEGLDMTPDDIGWIPWNPRQIWVPSGKGLGMGFVFDEMNRIYGKEMVRYK